MVVPLATGVSGNDDYQRVRGRRETPLQGTDSFGSLPRWLWVEWVFSLTGHRESFEKLGGPLRQIVLQGLAPAA
jgi:hypothetical protein